MLMSTKTIRNVPKLPLWLAGNIVCSPHALPCTREFAMDVIDRNILLIADTIDCLLICKLNILKELKYATH